MRRTTELYERFRSLGPVNYPTGLFIVDCRNNQFKVIACDGGATNEHGKRFLLADTANHVAQLVFDGLPLTYYEFHLAIACGFLIPPAGMGFEQYIQFYQNRWHETELHQGYGHGGSENCHLCKQEHAVTKKAIVG